MARGLRVTADTGARRSAGQSAEIQMQASSAAQVAAGRVSLVVLTAPCGLRDAATLQRDGTHSFGLAATLQRVVYPWRVMGELRVGQSARA